MRTDNPVPVLFVVLLALLGCTGAPDASGEPVSLRDAWIREPPPHSPAAAYLTIVNHSESAVELVAVETAAAERTEIHLMEHSNDAMTMRQTTSLMILGGDELALTSGGTHLMLIDPRQPLQAGEVVELVLRFADGTQRRVQAPVRKGGYASN